jgi:hypothetical protein
VAKRGNPYAIVRLEPEIMNIIQQRSEPAQKGRGGGVSQYLRQLVYAHLGLGDAPCFGGESPKSMARPVRRRHAEPHAAPELS